MRLTTGWRVAALTAAGALALAACGGDGTDAAAGDGAAGDGASADGELSGTVTVLHYFDEGAGGLTDLLEPWEQQFEELHPEVDLQFEYVPYDQMQQKVVSASAAGEGWDVILTASPWLPEFIAAGAVRPIDEYWDGFEDASQFPENTQGAGIFNDERYAVQSYANVEGIFYNQTILDELGLEVPTTLDELEEGMAAAQEAGYNAFSTAAPTGAGGEFNLVPWLASEGWTYEEAGDTEVSQEVLARLQEWRDAGYYSPNDATGFNAEKNFATGEYAFVQGGNWNLGSFADDLDFEWGAAVVEGHQAALLGGEVAAMGANTENADAAWAFIRDTLLTQEGQLQVAGAGSVPLRQDVSEDETITGDPNLSAFVTIAGNSIANPINENTGRISDAMGGVFNEFVAGQIDADEAAQRIADEVPPLME